MNKQYFVFIRNLILFSIVLAVVIYLFTLIIPESFITPVLPYLFVFFFSVTLLVHYFLHKVSQKKHNSFIRMFMLLSFGKLLFFLLVMILYAFIFRSDAKAFIIDFFLLYVFYTVFEVRHSLQVVKTNPSHKSS